jgi:hypothetical protein
MSTTDNSPMDDRSSADVISVTSSNSMNKSHSLSYFKRTKAFGDRVGWRKRRDWIYTQEYDYPDGSPEGNLPCGWGFWFVVLSERVWLSVFSRVETCKM